MAISNAQRAENDDEIPQTAPAGAKKQPMSKVRIENVEAAIWPNDSSNGTFYNVTFSRKYKDDEGKHHNSGSFNSGDLLALQEAARQAYSEIQKQRQKDYDQSKQLSR
jgi:hypothetical protein